MPSSGIRKSSPLVTSTEPAPRAVSALSLDMWLLFWCLQPESRDQKLYQKKQPYVCMCIKDKNSSTDGNTKECRNKTNIHNVNQEINLKRKKMGLASKLGGFTPVTDHICPKLSPHHRLLENTDNIIFLTADGHRVFKGSLLKGQRPWAALPLSGEQPLSQTIFRGFQASGRRERTESEGPGGDWTFCFVSQ